MTPAMVRTTQVRTTVRLWARTQRVSEDTLLPPEGLLATQDHYRPKEFILGIASGCNLSLMTEAKGDLRIEPPVAEQPPQSVGFLISQLGFFSSKGFMEALEPVGI